ncbi:hypothetical protein SAMN02910406_02006 [Ruminococcus albus]|uniref:Uncharacterized protein n=1 Tax=Ruminococcus albus TaxID=1264 RepID=A0A1I1KMK2_RUMAL|nr:hypothetical protein SAMN02910406_02006 [Ruminococcus albus]
MNHKRKLKMKDYSSQYKTNNVYAWSKWNSNHYVNKYVECDNPLEMYNFIRCTVKPLEIKDLKV